VSIDEGSREVWLPHETGVSLTTREHQDEYKQVTMADLMTETNYLNPDVELIAEINTPASFETFAEVLNTGHGVIGTTHAGDVETLVNRVVEQDLPTYLLSEIDLLVFPRAVDGDRYVGEVVEFVGEETFREYDRERDDDACGVVRKGETTVYWNTVARRTHDGGYDLAYEHPDLGDDARQVDTELFERLARLTDRPVEAVEDAFHRKHRYVKYLHQEGISDGEDLFAFLADLQTDEAATVERIRQRTAEQPSSVVAADERTGPTTNAAGATITLDDRGDRDRARRHTDGDAEIPGEETDGD
jgi:hypothetical protein